MSDMSVMKAIEVLKSFANHQFTAFKIRVHGDNYKISDIRLYGNQVVIVSDELEKEIKGIEESVVEFVQRWG